jgi:hypothetical protein
MNQTFHGTFGTKALVYSINDAQIKRSISQKKMLIRPGRSTKDVLRLFALQKFNIGVPK